MRDMNIIAHRGGAEGIIENENRVSTVRKAVESGVKMIEVDLRMYKNEIVLCHDEETKRHHDKLAELLRYLKGKKVWLNLEIKEIEVVPKLAKHLGAYSGKVVISSFDFEILKECRKLVPGVELAILEKWSGVRATRRAKAIGARRIHMNQRWLWSGFIWSMKKSGYKLYAYTVNSKRQAQRFEIAGIAGIFTDHPSKFTN